MTMIRNKKQSLRSQITCCKSDESTRSSSDVVCTLIKRQEVTGNSNNNSSNSNNISSNSNNNSSNSDSDNGNYNDNKKITKENLVKAGERFIQRCHLQMKIKNNRIVSSQKISPLSSISASLLHMEEENVCTSTNVARCTCTETFSRALSRRRDAVYEVEVEERIGLRLYVKLILRKRLFDSYF